MLDNKRIKEVIQFLRSLDIYWQVIGLSVFYLFIVIVSLWGQWQIAILLLLFLVILVLFFKKNYNKMIANINSMASDLSDSVKIVQEDAMNRTPIGILLYDEANQRVRWVNPAFQHIFGNQNLIGQPMLQIDPNFEKLLLLDDERQWQLMQFRDRTFKVLHQKSQASLYLMDVSEEMAIREQRKQDKLVFGYIFLDDYNEIVESMDDQQGTSFDSMIVSEVSDWANQYGIFTKRIDSEKFIILFNQLILDKLEESRFKHFEDLAERNQLRNTPLSISLGIAYPEADNYNIDQLADQAQLNLDLALGRGGDQVVVRSENGRARFYGGKTNPSEKRTNIRSRLVFQALKTSIQQANYVLITGHKRPDMDSISSAIGIYKICRQFKKRANIIVNTQEFNRDIKELLSMKEAGIYWDRNILIDIDQAKELADEGTLIIMVDHHRPSLSDGEILLDDHDVVIIDHHRRGEEFPENAVLTYIEPYASSASELITEFFMNMRNTTESLNKFEATALLAGVVVDTNNFSQRTGSRTFDVASYLKSRGADSVQIQRFMKEDMDTVIRRNHLFQNAKFVEPYYAVVIGPEEEVIDNITAAQTADALLDVNNVEASFVIYRRSNHEVGISARSLGTINVQTIMERLDGGGHLSNAATQLSNVSVQEAYQALTEQLNIEKDD